MAGPLFGKFRPSQAKLFLALLIASATVYAEPAPNYAPEALGQWSEATKAALSLQCGSPSPSDRQSAEATLAAALRRLGYSPMEVRYGRGPLISIEVDHDIHLEINRKQKQNIGIFSLTVVATPPGRSAKPLLRVEAPDFGEGSRLLCLPNQAERFEYDSSWVLTHYTAGNLIKKVESKPNPRLKSMDEVYQSLLKPEELSELKKLTNDANRVVITIYDNGIDYNHPGLAFRLLRRAPEIGHDYLSDDSLPDSEEVDLIGNPPVHGTHVSGIATRGDKRLAIFPLRYPNYELGLEAIRLAKASGSRIVNISDGNQNPSLYSGLIRAMDLYSDMLFMIAAGNNGADLKDFREFPASAHPPNSIVVASIDPLGKLSRFSNYGPGTVDIAAEGENIESYVPGGGTAKLSGTSMATPQVTRVAAKILEINPKLTAMQIKEIILRTADRHPELADKVAEGRVLNEDAAFAEALRLKR